ncbi:unnamed protein product [Penicillium bialowiezense]
MTVDTLDPREGMQRMHTPEERHLRDTALQELQTLKEAFAALRQQTFGRDAPDLNAIKGKTKGKKGKDVERLLISEITEPILPQGRDWIPAGHLLSQMEYLWLKKKGVTKAFLDCREQRRRQKRQNQKVAYRRSTKLQCHLATLTTPLNPVYSLATHLAVSNLC